MRWPPASWRVGGLAWNAALVGTMAVAAGMSCVGLVVAVPYAVGCKLLTGRWPR